MQRKGETVEVVGVRTLKCEKGKDPDSDLLIV